MMAVTRSSHSSVSLLTALYKESFKSKQSDDIRRKQSCTQKINLSKLAEAHSRFYSKKSATAVDLKRLDEDIDWWSKYYASTGDNNRCMRYLELYSDRLEVYNTELEKAEGFEEFNDFLTTFKFNRGRNLGDDQSTEEVGELKGVIKIYALPDDRNLPMPKPYLQTGIPDGRTEECVVRVYVLRAFELQPTDPHGITDPYVSVSIGGREVNSRDEYVPNSLNPMFGRMFELTCELPREKELYLCVKDRDLVLTDELIGETRIDLENRFLTRFRATVGLPTSYCKSGPNIWRDSNSPLQILQNFCEKYDLKRPDIKTGAVTADGDADISVVVGASEFHLKDFEKAVPVSAHWGAPEERLALHVLNCLPLVKEHVELRPLYTPLQPGIEQGKLQMFVDIFPTSLGPPGVPVDIRPREAQLYYLRVVIYNTHQMKTPYDSSDTIDLYVKGWIAGIDDTQKTDVHYRSLNGDGNFNWRFVFPLYYLPAEDIMVVKKKANFWSIDLTETRMPAQVVIQVWDNDFFGPDDCIGVVELPLTSMACPTKTVQKCNLKQIPGFSKGSQQANTMNIFDCRRTSGFWPVYRHDDEDYKLVGKVEMEVELVSEEEAERRPAGRGRDDPNENPHLDPPKRPDTSFLWFVSPWKSFRYIVWRRHKWRMISALFITLLATILGIFLYTIPIQISDKIFKGGGKSN